MIRTEQELLSATCGCKCHVGGPQATCDLEHDTGSSGVPGVPSCSPCPGPPVVEKCGRCGQAGRHHVWVEGDCILRHKKHSRATIGHVCEGCVERHVEWLTEIAHLYEHLNDVVMAGSIPDDTADHMRTKKAPASPSPFRLDAWAMLYGQINEKILDDKVNDGETMRPALMGNNLPDVAKVLSRWAQVAFDSLGWTKLAPATVWGAAAALQANPEAIAHTPEIDTYDAELRWVRRALRGAHGLSDPKPLGDCLGTVKGEACDGKVMPDRYGGQPQCTGCHRRYTDLDLVRVQITEEQTA